MICPKCERLMDAMGYDDWLCPNKECKYMHLSNDYDEDEEECDHVGGLVLTDCGDYCSRCGETFSDFTGSNLMGG